MSDRILSAEDRLDIMDLVARYARTLDAGDLDGYVNNFAPDGVLFGRLHGRDEIREYIIKLQREGRAGPLPDGNVAYRHFAQSATIDAESETRANVHSYLLWVFMGDEPPVKAAAEYLDVVEKIDGTWYFASRAIRFAAGSAPSPEPVIPQD